MTCPHCNSAMHLGRYQPGEYKAFRCNHCTYAVGRRKRQLRAKGYDGVIVLPSTIPLVHQEKLRGI